MPEESDSELEEAWDQMAEGWEERERKRRVEWAQQYGDPAGYEYFKFNPQNFTETQIEQMNSEIENQGRRIVVIVDPHIKASEDYFVY